MKILLTLLSFWGLISSSIAQPIDFEDIFGEHWKRAVEYEKENRAWIEPIMIENGISYPLAVAVIFPELIRYSAIRDKMEITLLKTLYINLGEEYANFSIGHFQMKPSFAELIRQEADSFPELNHGITLSSPDEYSNIINYRKSIVADLEDPRRQVIYLVAFLKICEKRFNIKIDDGSHLPFISTAYNYGIDRSASRIEGMINKKFFTTTLFKSELYSYAEISMVWYKKYVSENNPR